MIDQRNAASFEFPSTNEYFDVGQLLNEGMKIGSLSDKDKFALLTKHYKPGRNFAFPKTFMNGCKRSFRFDWFDKHPWLVYSSVHDGGYCLPCILFAKMEGKGALVKTPFNRWVKKTEVIDKHEQLSYRSSALIEAGDFKTAMLKPEKSIEGYLTAEAARIVAKNRRIITAMAECIAFCGRKGIALRGHRDDATAEDDKNRGNFIALVKFRAASGDTILKDHIENGPKNATYTSKNVQNELIAILGNQIRTHILEKVKAAQYYSILADEVTDISRKEQLALVVRYVDDK